MSAVSQESRRIGALPVLALPAWAARPFVRTGKKEVLPLPYPYLGPWKCPKFRLGLPYGPVLDINDKYDTGKTYVHDDLFPSQLD